MVVHSYGTSTDEGSPNWALAKYAETMHRGRPVYADRTLVDASEHPEIFAGVYEGSISDTVAHQGGSAAVNAAAKEFMIENNLRTTCQVAERHHVGRVVLEAAKLEIPAYIPPDLPAFFDEKAKEQWWTGSLGRWMLREIPGSFVLAHRGQLRLRDLF